MLFRSVKVGQFHLWAVDSVEEAIEILSGKKWRTDDDSEDLLSLIQERIARATQPETRSGTGLFRWLNWFNQR